MLNRKQENILSNLKVMRNTEEVVASLKSKYKDLNTQQVNSIIHTLYLKGNVDQELAMRFLKDTPMVKFLSIPRAKGGLSKPMSTPNDKIVTIYDFDKRTI